MPEEPAAAPPDAVGVAGPAPAAVDAVAMGGALDQRAAPARAGRAAARAAPVRQSRTPASCRFGDSTTASICYRALLWQMLAQQSGRTQFNFVGTRNGDPGCGVSGYDKDNEGHGGYIVTDVLKAAGTGTRPSGGDASDPFVSDARDLATWFDGQARRRHGMLHFATNDVWNNKAPAMILQAGMRPFSRAGLRAANPNVRVLVAQIIPLQPSGCNKDCPSARVEPERDDPGMGCNQQYGGVADHRRRSSHRLQPRDGTGHQRRRAPQRHRLSEDRDQVVQRADVVGLTSGAVTACAPGC